MAATQAGVLGMGDFHNCGLNKESLHSAYLWLALSLFLLVADTPILILFHSVPIESFGPIFRFSQLLE